MAKINDLFEFDNSFSCPCEGVNDLTFVKEPPCHCEERSGEAIQRKPPFPISHLPFTILIGTDEAGRGPGAGGVFASAVHFPNQDDELIEKLAFLNDSKKLSKKKREELYEIIIENTINSTVCVEVEEIEKINILNASLKAMRLACENVIKETQRRKDAEMQSRVGLLSHQHKSNILVLVDGNKLIKDFLPPSQPSPSRGEGVLLHQKFIIKGDSKSASIAAASILAKVSRDRYMERLHEKFPQYNWIKNAGYLTKEHLDAIEKYGITPIHRKSFLKGRNTKQLSFNI